MDLAAGVPCFSGDDDEAPCLLALHIHGPREAGRGE